MGEQSMNLKEAMDRWLKAGDGLFLRKVIDDNCIFGTEIECYHPLLSRWHEIKIKRPTGWRYARDYSVQKQGYELISPKLNGHSGLLELSMFLAKLRRYQYKSGNSCGAHTNLSIKHVGMPQSDKLNIIWKKYRTNFRKLPGARTSGYYCRGNTVSNFSKGSALSRNGKRLEFRLWRGTLDYKQWVAQIGIGYLFLKEALDV